MKRFLRVSIAFISIIIFPVLIWCQDIRYDRFEDRSIVYGKAIYLGNGFSATGKLVLKGDARKGFDPKAVTGTEILFLYVGSSQYVMEGLNKVKAIVDDERIEYESFWTGDKEDMAAALNVPNRPKGFNPPSVIKTSENIFVPVSLKDFKKISEAKSVEFKVGQTELRILPQVQNEIKILLGLIAKD